MSRVTLAIAGVILLVIAALTWAVDHYMGKADLAVQTITTMNGTIRARDAAIAELTGTVESQEAELKRQRQQREISERAALTHERETAAITAELEAKEEATRQAMNKDEDCETYLRMPVAQCVRPGNGLLD